MEVKEVRHAARNLCMHEKCCDSNSMCAARRLTGFLRALMFPVSRLDMSQPVVTGRPTFGALRLLLQMLGLCVLLLALAPLQKDIVPTPTWKNDTLLLRMQRKESISGDNALLP